MKVSELYIFSRKAFGKYINFICNTLLHIFTEALPVYVDLDIESTGTLRYVSF
jgi:hypothetical protein